jgi:hypothetical protein
MDGMQIGHADIGNALRKTALLADVTIGVWSAEKSDRKIMDKAKADAGAVGNVGRAIKNMLAGADGKLKEAQAAFTAVRTTHYGLTLPWVADPHAERLRGPRLLPTELFDKYAEEMGKRKRIAMEALDAFIADYPDAIVRAKANLAALADATYPTEAEVRAQFHINYDFVPMPAGQDFQGLPDTTLTALSKFLEAKQQIMVDGARKAMMDQIRKRVGKLAERLSGEDATFRASTVEAVRELVTLLPAWNINGEQEVIEITAMIDRMISGSSAEGLRVSHVAREIVQKQAQAIVDRLDSQ